MRIQLVTLREILGATRHGAATLVPEWAGYLMLGLGRATAGLPMLIDLDRVRLSSEGVLSIDGDNDPLPMTDALAQLQNLLQNMLELSNGYMPGLERAARQHGASIDEWMKGLRRALIPMNRAAAKRSLARLARETLRAKARGRIAVVQDKEFFGEQSALTPEPASSGDALARPARVIAVAPNGAEIAIGTVQVSPANSAASLPAAETALEATPEPSGALDDADISEVPPSMDLEATPTYVDLALSTGHHSAATEERDSVEILLGERVLEPDEPIELQAKQLNELVSPPAPRVIHCHRNSIKRVSLLQPLHLEVPHADKTDETFDGAEFLGLTNALHALLDEHEHEGMHLSAEQPAGTTLEAHDEDKAATGDADAPSPGQNDQAKVQELEQHPIAEMASDEASEESASADASLQDNMETVKADEPMHSAVEEEPLLLQNERASAEEDDVDEIEVDFSLAPPSAQPGDVCRNPGSSVACGGKPQATAQSIATLGAVDTQANERGLAEPPPRRWINSDHLARKNEALASQRFSEEFDDLEWSPEPGRNSQTPSGQTLDESLALRGSIPLFFPEEPPRRQRLRKLGGTLLVAAAVAGVGITWSQRPELFAGLGTRSAATKPNQSMGSCKATLHLRDLPVPHEVLVKLGTAPFESRPLPTQVPLELVATLPPLGAKRIALSRDTNWTKTPKGPLLTLDVELAAASKEARWPAYKAGTIGGSGPAGRVRFTGPTGADLWLVVAYGQKSIADVSVPCRGGADVLIVNPDAPAQRRRLRVEQELLQAASTTDGVELSAQPR